ncbi:recQ-mediated genome instability protein 1 [Selaginella moellendorffii]|uniref:recQ-mediated genome instability protein 1 n=1 Tax=Selaginella moellendorffii TaxID=88036 RepID=UPI000D1CCDEE|nr:recQ-mediated genome instability protein 1 [Selaginella moellendorffii]XP_024537993.1 recQ-mediated genome instability protein 1 [Selaginella moellendorffii]|eukprot:XP_024537992.1 recQ-mediated genome instability protein 1 [Selaginella moellendorffii]
MCAAFAEDQGSVKSEDSLTGRAKFLCSYGGRIMPRPHDSQLRYVGGETRILSVHRGDSVIDLMTKLRKICPYESFILKYQLPNEDLDALVSVISEEDLENMMEEYDRMESKDSSSRLRLFLFPVSVKQPPSHENAADPEHKFVEAVNGVYRKANVVLEEQHKKPVVLVDKAAPPLVAQQSPAMPMAGPQVVAVPPAVLPQVVPAPVPAPVQAPVPPAPAAASPAPTPVQALAPAAASPAQALAPAAASPLIPSVVPPVVSPQVLPPSVPVNLVTVPTKNLTAAVTPPRIYAPGTPSLVPGAQAASPVLVPQVVAARSVVPQVMAASRAVVPSSTYVPLVEVSRGILPKGMVIRQYSVEDEHSDSVSSQSSSQLTDMSSLAMDRRDSGESADAMDRRALDATLSDFEKLKVAERPQEKLLVQHIPRGELLDVHKTNGLPQRLVPMGLEALARPPAVAAATLGHQFYAPSSDALHRKLLEQHAIPRPVSTPMLQQAVEIPAVATATAHHPQVHRQFSDRSEPQHFHQQQENRPAFVGIGMPEVVIQQQRDERFPVLHPANGLNKQTDVQLVQKAYQGFS